jgi:multiple sugar transport system permease protein
MRSSRPRRALLRSAPLVPAVVLLAVFLAGPIVNSFYGSLTNASLTGSNATSPAFVGLHNYLSLFGSKDFPNALVLTIVFVVVSGIIGQNVVGLTMAVLLRHGPRPVGAAVSMFVVAAWVLPEVVAAFAGYALFSEDGTLNGVLGLVGVHGPSWLYAYPMAAVILANLWRGSAFAMMMYTAALQGIPPEITEAAQLDGAAGAKRFFLVTLPMIKGTVTTNMMLIVLHTLSVFTMIWVMTAGGPANKSTTLPVLAYQEAFQYSKLGYGTAIATIMLLVGAVFSVIYLRALRQEGAER